MSVTSRNLDLRCVVVLKVRIFFFFFQEGGKLLCVVTALSLGIVVWGQSLAKNRAQPRKEMKSRYPGKAMQKRVFTVWNELSLDWLCVARLTRLLL